MWNFPPDFPNFVNVEIKCGIFGAFGTLKVELKCGFVWRAAGEKMQFGTHK